MKNTEALALAYNTTRAKLRKIKELGITPKLTETKIEKLVITLAKNKADNENGDYKDKIKGMEWYVNDLVEFSKLTVEEQLELEYNNSFGKVASEDEMLRELEKLAA